MRPHNRTHTPWTDAKMTQTHTSRNSVSILCQINPYFTFSCLSSLPFLVLHHTLSHKIIVILIDWILIDVN